MSAMLFHRFHAFSSTLALAFCLLLTNPAHAVGLLRDADIEYGLKQIAAPILRAAGLSAGRVKILVVNEGSLNAFVVSNDAIYVHYGLINRMDNATMLQAVLAHEAAHIANGHITRRITNLGNANKIAGLGMALAVAAAAAGGGKAAAGIALGVQSSAQRSFLGHTRSEEASADQSAIRYMKSAGADPKGMSQVMELFSGQELLSVNRQDPYTRSHPLSRDRLRQIEAYVTAYGNLPADPQAEYWFARVKGKLSAYTNAPKWTLRRLKETPYPDVRYLREAVARHRQSQTRKAISAIDKAIATRPGDPFFYDMKGQILLETRNFGAAAASYGRGVQLAPNDALLLAGYGRALLANGQTKKALPILEKARSRDFRDGSMLRDLSVAYAKTGQTGMAALTTAERYALIGRLKDAGIHAKRAVALLPQGSGPWQRAQDVLIASERAEKKRK